MTRTGAPRCLNVDSRFDIRTPQHVIDLGTQSNRSTGLIEPRSPDRYDMSIVNVMVKIPMISEGLKALHVVAQEGISVNVTLIFSATQALLAAKNGAAIVSPFVGRLDDIGTDSMDLISDILAIYDNYEFPTEVLVASVRHPVHILETARMGAHIATMPLKVMEQLLKHPLTDIGLAKFLADWEKQKQLVSS